VHKNLLLSRSEINELSEIGERIRKDSEEQSEIRFVVMLSEKIISRFLQESQ
jgi:hypothetical protein